MTDDDQIISINMAQRFAITGAGIVVPITSMYDGYGDDTDDPAEAVSFVVKLNDRAWLPLLVADYESVSTN